MTSRPYTFDRVVRILFTLLGVGVLLYFMNSIKSALVPFFVAWLLAYLINPFVNFIQVKMKFKNRVLSVATALIMGVVLIVGAIFLLIPPISEQAEKLSEAIVALENSTDQPLIPLEIHNFINRNLNFDKIVTLVTTDDIKNLIQTLVPKLLNFIGDTFNVLVSVVASLVTLIYLVFILIDFEKISSGWMRLVPGKYQSIVSMVAKDVMEGMNSYFRGQALVAFCVGVLFSIGFSLIGLPLAILLGMFIGLLNLVPYLQLVGILPMMLLCFLKSVQGGESFFTLFALGILVLCVVQIIQDTILVPKIMGKVTGLNPAVILLALSVWGSLLGIIGMIIALPMTTLLLSYYRIFILSSEINQLKYTKPDNSDEEV